LKRGGTFFRRPAGDGFLGRRRERGGF